MIRLLRTDDHKIHDEDQIVEGVWVELTAPTPEEIKKISNELNVSEEDLAAAIDPDEKTRIEFQEDYILIIADIPIKETRHREENYKTIPLGIILIRENIVTVCAEETSILDYFFSNNAKEFSTKKKFKFFYQIMLRISIAYQKALMAIEKRRLEFEGRIEKITAEADLIRLHELESTLVYFMTSLRGNNNVLSRFLRSDCLPQYPEDRELFNDVIVENQQAIEMAQIYREIIDSTRELISSIINSRLNNVMKQLTSITIILSIPMVISGMYGMNVDQKWMPLAYTAHGFGIIALITILICVFFMYGLKKKKML